MCTRVRAYQRHYVGIMVLVATSCWRDDVTEKPRAPFLGPPAAVQALLPRWPSDGSDRDECQTRAADAKRLETLTRKRLAALDSTSANYGQSRSYLALTLLRALGTQELCAARLEVARALSLERSAPDKVRQDELRAITSASLKKASERMEIAFAEWDGTIWGQERFQLDVLRKRPFDERDP